jgi:hypothetical protein
MDKPAVEIITAPINRRGELPILAIVYSAIRRSISYFWTAFANMNPAINRKMRWSANPMSAVSMSS